MKTFKETKQKRVALEGDCVVKQQPRERHCNELKAYKILRLRRGPWPQLQSVDDNNSTIRMSVVPGQRLDAAVKNSRSKKALRSLIPMAVELAKTFHDQTGLHHGDVRLKNIIWTKATSKKQPHCRVAQADLVLIDFDCCTDNGPSDCEPGECACYLDSWRAVWDADGYV